MEHNRITVYRGSHQIGGCSTEICTKDRRILIDFGANLPDNDVEDGVTDEELYREVFSMTNATAFCFRIITAIISVCTKSCLKTFRYT